MVMLLHVNVMIVTAMMMSLVNWMATVHGATGGESALMDKCAPSRGKIHGFEAAVKRINCVFATKMIHHEGHLTR